MVLWVNPDETGGAAVGTLSGTEMTFYDMGNSDLRAYGDRDSVVMQARGGEIYPGIREFKFIRIGVGVFSGP